MNSFTLELCFFFFFRKCDSGYCVCEQETEEAVVNDVMSVKVRAQSQTTVKKRTHSYL